MPRRKQRGRKLEEQEAAKSLLQLANESPDDGPRKEQVIVPKKRGRKCKVKKTLPALMRKTKKVYSNYQKRYTDKMPDIPNAVLNSQIESKLDWEKIFPGFNPTLPDLCDSSSSGSEEQINKMASVNESISECLSSSAVGQSCKEDNEDANSTYSTESTISAHSGSEPLLTSFLPTRSIDSLPRSWLPLKKRRLYLEETDCVLTKEWQPPSPESLRNTPILNTSLASEIDEAQSATKKMSILEQACISAGIEKFDDSEEVQVTFDGIKCGLLPPSGGSERPSCPVKPMAIPPVIRPSVYPNPAMWRPFNVPKQTVHCSEQQPLNLCSKSDALNLLNLDFTLRNNSAQMRVSYPQLKSQVHFRIMSENWRMQPKCSVYEMQPYEWLGQCPPYMVTTFVLVHKERSETKSLHYLNRFPSQGQVKFEYLHSAAIHPLCLQNGMRLPNHLHIQSATEDQFFSSEGLEILRNQFPGSAIFTVVEDNQLVVNKVAVSEVSDNLGIAHIKVFAHSKAILKLTKLAKITYDPWIFKSTDAVEAYRLTIPAWMFFSREVIRLHNIGHYPRF